MRKPGKFVIAALSALAIVVAAAGTIALSARPNQEEGLKNLPGSWNVAVVSDLQGPFPGLLTFISDGSLIGDPPPIGTESTSHGTWVRTGPDSAAYTFVALITNDQRVVVAMLKVIGTLQYDGHTDSWSGPYKLTVKTTDGAVELGHDGGTFRLTRIAVETLH